MKKIPTLFQRDPEDRAHVIDAVNPGCEWVLKGEGTPTVKWDGTCVMFDTDGRWWARREVKPGKNPPENWVEVEADSVTGKRMGWEPIEQSSFAKFHAEALTIADPWELKVHTYELVGPKINGNPHGFSDHVLLGHGWSTYCFDLPLTYKELREELLYIKEQFAYEGIVWHHPDGRRAKLKARDFK